MADYTPTSRSVGPPQAPPRWRAPTLPELVERWIREIPDAVALIRGEHHLTYGELGRRALRLARRLTALGVGPESPVGVCLPPSPNMLVAWLAVTRAGGAYVPLEPEHPAARRRWMLEDAGVRALIATGGSARELAGGDLPVLGIGGIDGAQGIEGHGGPEPAGRLPGPLPDHPAYVLYTSGSTGRPKGVVVTHRSLANVLDWYRRHYRMGPGVRSSQIAGAGFDASVLEIWPALTAGATVVFPPAPLRGSARELGRFLTRERIDVAFVPPVMARELAEESTLPPLAAMILGGDRAPAMPPLPFPAYNHYGPTEATVQVTAARIETGDPAPPIGRPIDRVRVHLLDEDLQPVGSGEVGEIWVAGAGVSRGYVGRPGRTAEVFRPDPLAQEPGRRMYRTGDLGRRRSDGRLEFRGRVDDQVNVRGVRVEPGEVEAVLEEHPAVHHAVVALREPTPGDERLVAWVVVEDEGRAPEEDLPTRLRRHLTERLPAAFVPTAIQPVAELPRTPRGKVDREALPTPKLADLAPSGPRVAPRTERERELLDLFQEVLGLPDLGIEDDFFDLGGHSLLATRLVSRIRRRWGVELPVAAVFDAPTVAALAHRMEAAEDRERALPPIERRPRRGDVVPLSYAQERLWFLDRLQPGNPFYNIPMAWNLEGPVGSRTLAQALGEIVRRHEALRTRLPARGGEARQQVDPPAPWTVREVDLTGLAKHDRNREAHRLGRREAGRPFRLDRDRLVRTARLRLAPERSVFLLTIHHVVADGWSLGVLVDEIAPLYETWSQGRPSPLAELPIQYADFASWQREHVAGEFLERELDHWQRRLAGAPRLELPLDRPRPTVQTFRGARRRFTLEASAARRLRDLSRRHGASLFMTLLAGFEALLARLTGETDLVLGVPVANRHREELEGLVGFFVNSLALRTDLSGDPGFADAVERVRETTLDAYAHQDLPFERLVERISPERDLSKNPLFQLMFVLQNAPAPERSLGETRLSTLPVALHTTRFDLEVHLFEAGEHLEGFLFYDRDLFDATTVERLHRMYSRLLTAAGESPELRLSELPLLTSAQIHHLVREHNDVATAYPADATLDRLFQSVAAATPDAVALAFDDHAVTYVELARRAESWARRLAARGIEPGDRVGLLLPRSPEMIVATLAVLEAGAAYVPLDPDDPSRRLELLTEDAGLGAILSTSEHLDSLPEDLPASVGVWDLASPGPTDPGIVGLPASGSRREPQSLAYVIYTSGSTGRPKGVAVSDRAVVRLVRETDYVRLTPRDRVAHASNVAFDAATFEIWGALLTGATLVGISKWVALTPEAMARKLAEERVTTLFLTTALFQQLVREAPGGFAGLTHLLFGGEACDPNRVRELLDGDPPRRLLHVYGPTESTTYATWHRVETVPEGVVTVPIGGPLSNTTAHVVDPGLGPVPLGAPGELVLGADGLARGYLGRPELTAQRFVPDPHAPAPGGRLYRTGDRVRRRAGGAVEFLGRVDHQVKLRGFRIELGEIETALLESPWVREVVAQVREDSPGDRRLVAYVVPTEKAEEIEPEEGDAERLEEQVSRWEMIFDNIYGDEETHGDATFNIVGWRSTYTGEPLPAEDMREWLDDTVGRILDAEPRRVLEIGCGTGLLLFRIAPRVERYLGLDLSQRALDYVDRQRRSLPEGLPGVTLAQAPADDFRHVEAGAYDTVVLNSVVQYFPSVDYLVQVVENAVSALGPEGRIFLGDLRSLPLLETFHTGVQLHRADDDLPLAQLRHRVRTALEEEEELALDPALFYALARHLPEIRRVEVFPKRGRADNELTRFRYQVVLTVRKGDLEEPPPGAPVREGHDLDAVRRFVETARDPRESAAWKDLPNPRLTRERSAVELLAAPPPEVETAGDLKARLAELPEPEDAPGAHPQDLWELSTETWAVTPSWGRHGADGRLDATARRGLDGDAERLRAPEPAVDPRKPWSAYGNDPLRGKFARRVAPRLEAWLGQRLPTYMIPSLFVPLPEMPLNPNGKVDRKALPAPESLGAGSTAQAAPPRTAEEQAVARVWCDVLGLESVGVEDDFFDLGGHSLLGTQVVSRLRKTLGVELPLSALFETPELGDLARRIARLAGAGEEAGETPSGPPLEPLTRVEREGRIPLSFAQERLWFLDRLESGGSFYNSGAAFDLQGPLSASALDGTLTRLLARHEALRTTFPLVDGEPVQRIAPPTPARVARVDLSGLESADARRTAQRLLGRAYRRLFDLAVGPLARFAWLYLGPGNHRLSLAVHHAVFDGWSLGVVVRELARLYEALATGRPDPLPEPEIQYADFAVWQRRWLTGAVLERQLEYWRRRLDGAPEVELPLDRPRPPAQRFRGDTVALELSAEAAETLVRLARDRSTTLYVVLLAALETLLGRYSRQTDLVVGTPVAHRNRQEIEGLVGFFANTLVMRGDLAGDPPFATLVERLAAVTLEAYAHQDLPFERLVEELQPERDLSRNPIFQVMLALQNAPLPPLEMHDTTLELLPWEGETARFDLEIHLWEGDDGLGGELIYDVDLFDRTTALRFARSFETLLGAAGAAPEQRLSHFPVLSPAQRHQARVEWQGGEPAAAGARDLLAAFLDRAARQPDAVALVTDNAAVTYGELARRSLGLARHLRQAGVGPDVPVGLCMQRSLEMPTTVLAILAAGGGYLSLDPAYPTERLAFMVEDARLPLLVTHGAAGRSLARPTVQVIDLETLDWAALEPLEPAMPMAPPESLAYVIYTSGSTGRPKGIAVPRTVLAHLIAWQVEEFPKPFRTLQFSSLSFDVSTQEIFATWATGSTVVLVEEEVRRNPAALWELMQHQQVERLFLPFVALDQLAEAAAEPSRLAPSLREVITAGEQVRSTPALTGWFEALPDARLFNHYGPSETHISVTYPLPADPARWRPLPPIGRPVGGGVARVLGREGEPVPVGGVGELLVGGVCPARGYLGRPARTATSFVPDPFADVAGARLYRTGDLVRWDAGGDLLFLGRVDQQVKIRGFRVEPGEVETVLTEHPEVAEAVVVASDAEGAAERRLVAYLKRRDETEDDLALWLRERLPEYLVPSAFVTVDSLPLTPSGKVDRGRLARRSLERTEAAPYVAPRTATEVVVAKVWAEVLGVERVGARDHFFRLGGHSLLATRVLARLRQELDLELPLKDLFEAPTVASLAQRAERAIRRRPLPPVTPVPRAGDLPLSFAQQRLWLVDRLDPGTALYNFPLPLRLEGLLGAPALEQALGEIRRRHEILRTAFPAAGDDGDPVQRVGPPETFRLTRVDLSRLYETDRDAQIRRLVSEGYLRPFDLAADELWRGNLLWLDDGAAVLSVHTHHIVFDGGSIGVFLHELGALYGAARTGEASPLAELAVQYGDFAVWQRTHLTDLVLAEQLAHWRRRLAGVAPLELPTDRPRPPVASSAGGRFETTLAEPARRALHELASRRGTTPFVTALAATTALLGRLGTQDDVAVGAPVAGRTREEVRDLLGFFVQTLVLRTSLAGDPDFLELAARAEETSVAAHSHQDVPFERLVAELADGRDLSRNPLFQVMLTYQELAEDETRLPGLTVSPAPFEITTSKFDLTLSLTGSGSGFRAAWAYRSDLFDETTVRRFGRAFETLLVEAAAEPSRPVESLPLLAPPERHQTLVEWNDPASAGPTPAPTLRAALARRAARQPDAVALVFEDHHLSYGEASRRAAFLARALRRAGAAPGSLVGVCLERRAETTVALLGILEAGAAYVPMDPADPDERLATLVTEARPVGVVTDNRWESRVPAGPPLLRVDQPVRTSEPDAAMNPGLQPWERNQRGMDLPVYVLFTSGSTGRPKGVVVPNRAVLHRLGWAVDHEPGADRLLQKVSLGFDISVAEVFLPLLAGGTTILAQPGGEKDGAYLARLIDRERIGLAGFATSSLENLLEHGDLLDGSSLRRVLVGAEVVPPDLPGRFARHVDAELLNRYGPTEATVSVLSWPCHPGEVGHALPVGRPIAGTRVYLLDRRLEPAPLGVPGQIHLGGPCLATGYLARPGRTAAAFVPHPFSQKPGARLYATGDLGRYRGDGALFFLGRLDHQVKVRGLRVELGEVETILGRHPAVDRVAVLLADDRLVAWVAPEGAEQDELIRWVGERLPTYMVPSAVGFLPALPTTTSGKVDRRALDRRPLAVADQEAADAPATPTEELLAVLWAEVLDVESPAPADDFFDLGGHSLLATRLISRVRRVFGVELPLQAVFEASELRALAACIDQTRRRDDFVAVPPLEPAPDEAPPEPSFGQERLWFLDHLEESRRLFLIPAALRLAGSFQPRALEHAWSEVLRRHETLRTILPEGDDGRPRVRVRSPRLHRLPWTDLTGLARHHRKAEARRLAAAESRRPMEVDRGPLARLRLLRLGAENHAALLTLHHVVADGWSLGVVFRQLGTLLQAFGAGTSSPLAEPVLQYADFAAWQRKWLTGEILETQVSWWRQRLAGVEPVLELPTDRPRPPVQAMDGGEVERLLPAKLTAELTTFGRRQGATPFLLLLAAWGTLLARLSGQRAVIVGTPVAGRNQMETEDLVGFFVNTLALPVRADPDRSFADLLARVREDALAGLAHQDLPFERLVEELVPERHLDRPPLVQALLAVQDAAEADRRTFDLPNLEVSVLPVETSITHFELTLAAVEREGALHLSLVYAASLFDATTARRFLSHLTTLLEAVVATPEAPVAALPWLGAAQRHQLLVEWNDTATEASDSTRALTDLVLEQARSRPEAVALVAGTHHLSHGETVRRAWSLVSRLTAAGVEPEASVAVCLGPSPEMVWAWLGVLLAGGAYVPLDPDHPDARLSHLLRDVGARVVVVEAPGRFVESGVSEIPLGTVDDVPGQSLPSPEPEPDRLAYVLYTSGSTGRPKGVLVPHRGLVGLIDWYRRCNDLEPGTRMSQWASTVFDVSVVEVWTGLASGATVIVAPAPMRSSVEDLGRWLEREAVEVAFLAPVLASDLIETRPLPALRRLIVAGDRAPRLCRPPFAVLNGYGPTEATVLATAAEVPEDGSEPPIGRPLDDFRVDVLDPSLRLAPPGVTGELWISGPGVARGYRNRPRQTAEAFCPDPFAERPGERAYRTGDLARRRPDGVLDFLGRADHQVKIRGVRVELGEIEAVLAEHPAVRQAVAALRHVAPDDDRLVAWVVPETKAPREELVRKVRDHAARHLPQVLRPSFIVPVAEIPRSDRGKIERDRLPDPAMEPAAEPSGAEAPLSSLESLVAQAFADVLGVVQVGPRDSFFDLGGHSLLLVRLRSRLKELGHDLPLLDFFRHPTVRSLATRLAEATSVEDPETEARDRPAAQPEPHVTDRRVAVVGLAGRFPKAPDVERLWRNLEAGVEGITFLADEELAARGVEHELLADPHYVKGRGLVDDVDRFDAEFFGYSPREAQILDPQQRIFLETCWQALEDAGCDPERFDGRIGVFAAASPSEYLSRLHTRPDLIHALGHLQITLGNQQDFLATRVSYELDLKGPSVSVATACSSSLTAVHLAVRSLVDGECDLALAGGVSIAPLSQGGYLHHPGGISSLDGHTRAFDARGAGTVSSDGAGVVVLRRLEDARTGGDPIRAMILGSAFNNDGSHKIGFTAPSIDGQAEVIRDAQRAAGVEASSIGYVEAHGTATPLGDPIEVAALTRAFREGGDPRRGVCALGSVKSNLGHLDAAAGVTGLIKTVLALEHATIPASLHVEEPNPELGLDDSPFRIAAATEPWEADGDPRRAGVSSFGLGGTNVHVVLEEAPQAKETEPAEPPHRSRQLLVLSARTPTALAAASERLASHLETTPALDPAGLADVAWTLQVGRKGFPHRRVLVAETREDAVEALRSPAEEGGAVGLQPEREPSLVYLLPGSGAQYPGMGEGLYRGEPALRQVVDRGCEFLEPRLGLDLRRLLFAPAAERDAADQRLRRTDCAMPAVVLVEIALARLLESWGLRPAGLLGHSLGEYTAAHLAGVLDFEAVLTLVALRGRLFDDLPAGATLSVEMPVEEMTRRLPAELSLSAVNGPALVNVSGPEDAVARLEEELSGDGITLRRLHVDMAAHSSLVEPILEPFGDFLETLDLQPPRLPYVSGLTGDWIRPEEATDPRYWVRHLRETARFADGAGRLLADPDRVFLEVGPGRTLATLTRRHPARQGQGVHTSMNPPGATRNDQEVLLEAVGRLWIDGLEPDWTALHGTDRRRRVPLPTYPFERRRCWVEAGDESAPAPRAVVEPQPLAAGGEGGATQPEAPSAGDAAASPETPLERRLAGFFRDLLGVDRLGRHDDFFELGGSSLLAVRLRSMLEETFGVTLSPHFLLEAPTVARLTRLLEAEGAETQTAESLEPTESEVQTDEPAVRARLRVQLQEGRPEETPLFLIHPVGGHVYFYRELARELGGELPIWGLRASGLEPGEEPLSSIEEMAERYLEEVRQVQPVGPCRLGGSSLGGVVAYEMARRLADRGEEVSFLALLDAPGPGHLPPKPEDEAELLAQLFGELLGLDAEELRALDEESRLELVVEAFRRSDGGIGERFGVEEARRQVQVLRAGMAALFAYEGGSYDGSVLFLRARERRPQDPAHPELAWIDRAAGVEVHVVPGDHVSMHQPPHRSVLVERLRGALERSRREVVTP